MIKNKKGVSVITVVITVLILIMIASITIFTGVKMVGDVREKAAKDRLTVIYNAIIANEDELGYGDTVIEKQITAQEYTIMELSDYANEGSFTPVYVSKEIDTNDSTKRIYKLKTLIKKNSDDWYEMKSTYDVGLDNTNSKIEFDVEKGVNRPQVVGNMVPIVTYLDEDNDLRTREVQNLYTEDWYEYSFTTPRWANAELDDMTYVWIPRFAYKVHDFYLNKNYDNVPSSAIKITFLKENTDYMANGEILPDGYQVHPAFSTESGELAGIWIAKYSQGGAKRIANAVSNSEGKATSELESHLMRNTEWAAMAYLSFACGGNSITGNTLNNSYGIVEINEPTMVAACIDTVSEDSDKFDIYTYAESDGTWTYESNEEAKNGDAMIATSSKDSENSAWFRGVSILPTADKPYVLRRGDISFFAYEAYAGTTEVTSYRNVLIIK